MRLEQRVQVEILGAFRPYSYAWYFDPTEGEHPLTLGDRVELPPNQVQEEGSSGTVIALGTDYKGELKEIVRKIEPKASDDDLWLGWGEGKYA